MSLPVLGRDFLLRFYEMMDIITRQQLQRFGMLLML